MPVISLTQAVKAQARVLGFDLAGVTTPESPLHCDVYERWLEAGRQGEMTYLGTEGARHHRADPRLILPECRSILVLGAFYTPPGSAPSETGVGRVAAYAWGEDYHEVFPERLKSIVKFIEVQVGKPVPNHWYTDTGPLLERELAQRAGLGWIGKNTCLIHPRLGSYFLLAEILLGVELEADTPFEADHCGSCTRCIDACPTGCILPNRTLDARRCISYLTIEKKGAIPLDLRTLVENWVFGCDICQQVCPWNLRFARATGEPNFAPRPGVPEPSLAEEIHLSLETFNRKFKGSPVKRAKRRGYLRNVAVALGNGGQAGAIPALTFALNNDPEPLVRAHAAWALGQIGGQAARQALIAAQASEQKPDVREEIQVALQAINYTDDRREPV
jgi:epoxyqueuosine reductase